MNFRLYGSALKWLLTTGLAGDIWLLDQESDPLCVGEAEMEPLAGTHGMES